MGEDDIGITVTLRPETRRSVILAIIYRPVAAGFRPSGDIAMRTRYINPCLHCGLGLID